MLEKECQKHHPLGFIFSTPLKVLAQNNHVLTICTMWAPLLSIPFKSDRNRRLGDKGNNVGAIRIFGNNNKNAKQSNTSKTKQRKKQIDCLVASMSTTTTTTTATTTTTTTNSNSNYNFSRFFWFIIFPRFWLSFMEISNFQGTTGSSWSC